MTLTIRAVYQGGMLRPVQPLALEEGETVDLTIATPVTPPPPKLTVSEEEETIRRIQASKTYREWLKVTKLLPPDDGGYDISKALNENRIWSGERPLVPDMGPQS